MLLLDELLGLCGCSLHLCEAGTRFTSFASFTRLTGFYAVFQHENQSCLGTWRDSKAFQRVIWKNKGFVCETEKSFICTTDQTHGRIS